MLLLPGSDALSAARFMRLSQQVAELDSKLMLRHAYFIYAIDAEGELDSEKLGALLQPGTSPAEQVSVDHFLPGDVLPFKMVHG